MLNLDPRCLGLRTRGQRHQFPLIDQHVIEKILNRCGWYLEKIIDNVRLDLDFTDLITEYCSRNIQSITGLVSLAGLQNLSRDCKNIVELRLKIVEGEGEGGAVQNAHDPLFSYSEKHRKLRILDIENFIGTGEWLLKLAFEEIEEIRIESCGSSFHKNVKSLINKTKKLRSLQYDFADEKIIMALVYNCSNLTTLDLTCQSSIENIDSLLTQVFGKNKNLKSLKLRDFKTLSGRCLLDLDQNTVEEITFDGTKFRNSDYLMQSLPNFVKFHSLELRNEVCADDDDSWDRLCKCINQCQSLRKLTIDRMWLIEENLMKAVIDLKNLETLKVLNMNNGDGLVTKEFLNYISCNLKELKYLDLHYYRKVYDDDYELLSNLQNLEVLYFCGARWFAGWYVENLPNLKKLYCEECMEMDNDFLIRILKCAPKLEYLDITFSKYVTSAVIKVAIEETKKRTNNIVLEIHINGCNDICEELNVNQLSPLLYVNTTKYDYTERQLSLCEFLEEF